MAILLYMDSQVGVLPTQILAFLQVKRDDWLGDDVMGFPMEPDDEDDYLCVPEPRWPMPEPDEYGYDAAIALRHNLPTADAIRLLTKAIDWISEGGVPGLRSTNGRSATAINGM